MDKKETPNSSILGDSYIKTTKGTIVISAGLKLIAGWVIFAVFCIVYAKTFIGNTKAEEGKNATPSDASSVTEADATDTQDASESVTGEEDAYIANSTDMEIPEGASYEKCEDYDVQVLISTYLKARVSCDQATLKSIVTDSSEYEDITNLQNSAIYIKKYNNTICYITKGYDDDHFIVFELSNLSINDVDCQPLDIRSFYIVKNEDGIYKIDNAKADTEVETFINNVISSADVQKLYQYVKDDNDYLLSNNQSFSDFYKLISGE